MDNFCAFIDETGDPHFTEGGSPTFFVCATVVNANNVEAVQSEIEKIKAKNDVRELKSSRISSDSRRSDILSSLAQLPIAVFTILVEKEKLSGDWFRFRKTFYKYVQRRLVSELFRVYGSLDVTFDRYGSDQYQNSFKGYIERNLQLEIFSQQIYIESAKTTPLIQISDIIGGSIRKYYGGEYLEAEEILKNVWRGKLRLPDRIPAAIDFDTTSAEDGVISSLALESVRRYLDQNGGRRDKEEHCSVLEYLRQMAHEEPEQYCFRAEIKAWMKFLGMDITEENISRTVLSELRDEGVVLVSSNDGVKIPVSFREIEEHYKFMLGQAIPILRRLKMIDQIIEARLPEKRRKLIESRDSDVMVILEKLHS